jgi:hypothetical protein
LRRLGSDPTRVGVWSSSQTLEPGVASQGAIPARPARKDVKALHVPGLWAPNSLFHKRFGAAEVISWRIATALCCRYATPFTVNQR